MELRDKGARLRAQYQRVLAERNAAQTRFAQTLEQSDLAALIEAEGRAVAAERIFTSASFDNLVRNRVGELLDSEFPEARDTLIEAISLLHKEATDEHKAAAEEERKRLAEHGIVEHAAAERSAVVSRARAAVLQLGEAFERAQSEPDETVWASVAPTVLRLLKRRTAESHV